MSDDQIQRLTLRMYTDESCRICGKPITAEDLDNDNAVYAGYSADNKSRAAHRRCWEGLADMAGHVLLDNERLLTEIKRLQERVHYWRLAYTDAKGGDVEREEVLLKEISRLKKAAAEQEYDVPWQAANWRAWLPSAQENVLTAWHHKKTGSQHFTIGYRDKGGHWFDVEMNVAEPNWHVTHWCPLPPLPKV